jgi:DNA-binding transcriptional MerR regulator
MYTVKEAAQRTGLTEHAVRFYTDKELVPSLRRDEHNHRIFDEESLNWLYGVKCLKQIGMPIETIKEYVDLCLEGDSSIPQRYALMVKHKEAALAKFEEMKRHIAYLE